MTSSLSCSAKHSCFLIETDLPVTYVSFLLLPRVSKRCVGGPVLWNQLLVWFPKADTVSVFKTVYVSVAHKIYITACLVSCRIADSRYGPPGSEGCMAQNRANAHMRTFEDAPGPMGSCSFSSDTDRLYINSYICI